LYLISYVILSLPFYFLVGVSEAPKRGWGFTYLGSRFGSLVGNALEGRTRTESSF
jgi:hypothetical protein